MEIEISFDKGIVKLLDDLNQIFSSFIEFSMNDWQSTSQKVRIIILILQMGKQTAIQYIKGEPRILPNLLTVWCK